MVRVVHVLAPKNTAYQASLPRPEHRAVGETVDEVWHKMLRFPDRFVALNPLYSSMRTSRPQPYVDRYAPVLVQLAG